MKNLMTLIVLVSLASCGRASKTTTEEKAAVSSMEETTFVKPVIGFHRSITVDTSLASIYENLTVNPEKNGDVLGDRPFFVLVSEYVNPSYAEYQLQFYSGTKINSVVAFDSKAVANMSALTMTQIQSQKMSSVNDFYRNDFAWGKKNIDNPSQDMLNKAYIFNLETMEKSGSKTFKVQSSYLVWFECDSKVEMVRDLGYTCGTYGLKFHYKLMDYKMGKVE